MEAIRDAIGNREILIQTVDIDVVGEEIDEYGTTTTSVEDVKKVYARAKEVVGSIAEDFGKELNEIGRNAQGPDSFEMQFSLGFSAKANAWFLSAGGDYTFSVKMTWNLGKANE